MLFICRVYCEFKIVEKMCKKFLNTSKKKENENETKLKSKN